MATSSLAALALAGVIERTGRMSALRVTPRFMAHAEQMHANHGWHAVTPVAALQAALAAWPAFRANVANGASELQQFMDARDQLGVLQPVWPMHASPITA